MSKVPVTPPPRTAPPLPPPQAPVPVSRLTSLDAYRGFVMLAMASAGLGFASVARSHPEILKQFDGTTWQTPWTWMWGTLAFHLDHVDWHGCGFWDLIQPSFMFMVGVALPFSLSRRQADGQSSRQQFLHVLLRSAVLVLLGIFLSSNGRPLTEFTFVNVLTQIGLAYPFLYLMAGRQFWLQALVAIAVLGGYGAWFGLVRTTAEEEKLVREYVAEMQSQGRLGEQAEFDQFTGPAAAWNKHLNPAASFDRWFLNLFPHDPERKPAWNGRQFWINSGGYQTLNFVPSFATMLLGLMAGQLLRSDRSHRFRLWWLAGGGVFCVLVALGLDTKMWPVQIAGCDWSICPIVKKIWTPTWTLYSTGWTLWLLAGFYLVIDVIQWRRWAFPFVVVGMNSIAMYCIAQLLGGWLEQTAKTHLATLDASWSTGIVPWLFQSTCSEITLSVMTLTLMWLMCLWLYRQKIFVRI